MRILRPHRGPEQSITNDDRTRRITGIAVHRRLRGWDTDLADTHFAGLTVFIAGAAARVGATHTDARFADLAQRTLGILHTVQGSPNAGAHFTESAGATIGIDHTPGRPRYTGPVLTDFACRALGIAQTSHRVIDTHPCFTHLASGTVGDVDTAGRVLHAVWICLARRPLVGGGFIIDRLPHANRHLALPRRHQRITTPREGNPARRHGVVIDQAIDLDAQAVNEDRVPTVGESKFEDGVQIQASVDHGVWVTPK